jgi:hypothetical protein
MGDKKDALTLLTSVFIRHEAYQPVLRLLIREAVRRGKALSAPGLGAADGIRFHLRELLRHWLYGHWGQLGTLCPDKPGKPALAPLAGQRPSGYGLPFLVPHPGGGLLPPPDFDALTSDALNFGQPDLQRGGYG